MTLGFPSPCELGRVSFSSRIKLLLAPLFKIYLIVLGTKQVPNKCYYYFMGHWKASWSQTTAYGKEIYFFTVSLRGTELAKVIWHRSAQESSHRVGGGSPVCHVGVSVLGGVAGIQVRPGSTPSPGVSQSSPHRRSGGGPSCWGPPPAEYEGIRKGWAEAW